MPRPYGRLLEHCLCGHERHWHTPRCRYASQDGCEGFEAFNPDAIERCLGGLALYPALPELPLIGAFKAAEPRPDLP